MNDLVFLGFSVLGAFVFPLAGKLSRAEQERSGADRETSVHQHEDLPVGAPSPVLAAAIGCHHIETCSSSC